MNKNWLNNGLGNALSLGQPSALRISSLQFNDCPKCGGGVLSFEKNEDSVGDVFTVSCNRCGCKAVGDTWREALLKWNSMGNETLGSD